MTPTCPRSPLQCRTYLAREHSRSFHFGTPRSSAWPAITTNCSAWKTPHPQIHGTLSMINDGVLTTLMFQQRRVKTLPPHVHHGDNHDGDNVETRSMMRFAGPPRAILTPYALPAEGGSLTPCCRVTTSSCLVYRHKQCIYEMEILHSCCNCKPARLFQTTLLRPGTTFPLALIWSTTDFSLCALCRSSSSGSLRSRMTEKSYFIRLFRWFAFVEC
ncbi:hypothetical protein SCLCIDRAFT_884234 [Scleroderma citrinum Foug A]|uniref:Uncharacterized protein n=1 Tax=Scleroderma citrinum Foug A TaxID=1036808 RepID=A0A0C3EKB6_9AGAM|nr:hypothetical protein SCLCIDRAFT_884234 [Scleroderma citrinum Foug A]